jgi:hypothetical protein
LERSAALAALAVFWMRFENLTFEGGAMSHLRNFFLGGMLLLAASAQGTVFGSVRGVIHDPGADRWTNSLAMITDGYVPLRLPT